MPSMRVSQDYYMAPDGTVHKRVTKHDGPATYVSADRVVAQNLNDFRKLYPNQAVKDAPSDYELNEMLSRMPDEQLESLGLSRARRPRRKKEEVEVEVE